MPLDERHQANFDHPDSLDSDMLVNHILRLKQGLTVEMPLYDFKTHTRSDQIEIIEPKPVVIVEGIQKVHPGQIVSTSVAAVN